ncbi:MAG: hypothetical protein HXX13_18655 [Bacteroidetes bacterium]|nr:hypothetical protein [Bacteroidota bacterium]
METGKLKKIRIAWIAVLALFIITTMQGCSSYYSVKDRSTGEIYYTTGIEEFSDGIRLKDEKTSALVTIRNFDVTRIEKEDYLYLLNQPRMKMIAPVIPRSQDETDPDVSVRRRE